MGWIGGKFSSGKWYYRWNLQDGEASKAADLRMAYVRALGWESPSGREQKGKQYD